MFKHVHMDMVREILIEMRPSVPEPTCHFSLQLLIVQSDSPNECGSYLSTQMILFLSAA